MKTITNNINNQIEPARITFQQAKKLKELECQIRTRFYFDNDGNPCEDYYDNGQSNWNGKTHPYEGYQIKTQILKECYARLEQWQIVEWLLLNHGIWVAVTQELGATITYCYLASGKHRSSVHKPYFKSPQEAYSAAFDDILNNLL
jgi:hypothetical protein